MLPRRRGRRRRRLSASGRLRLQLRARVNAGERLNLPVTPVGSIPEVLLVVDRHALLVELVAEAVCGFVVVTQARGLPVCEDLADLLIAERRHENGARAPVCRVPLVLLRVEIHAVLFELVAQHIGGLVVAPCSRLLTVHEGLLHLLDAQPRRTRARSLLRVRRRDIDGADLPGAPVSGLPAILLGVEVHAVLLELVTQAIGGRVVAGEARVLALLHQPLDLLVGERGGAGARRLLRVQLRDVDCYYRPAAPVGGTPHLVLVVESHVHPRHLLA
mmetsp:Transcript_32848/g.77674  ORF Transcript_32848/g.77674 Transcript_32848/m.77674 type:complete len:274 (-) Transcript_32848:207-1028(-)